MSKINSKSARAHLAKDSVMAEVVKGYQPLDLPPVGNVFHELVKAIAYQQISYKAADTIYMRFIAMIGSESYSPDALLKIEHEALRSVGFSNRKAEYVKNIAQFFKEKKLVKINWDKYENQEIIKLLSSIKGVGEWTVEMMLMFQLQREDVFPLKDLGIQHAIKGLYKLKEEGKDLNKKMIEIAAPWAPYRTLASLYLWSWKRANP